MIRLGVVDLGTNSVRFDVHQLRTGGASEILHREKWMVRLGENLFLNGALQEEAYQRAIEAFSSFRKTARFLGVDRMVAFGTSALRDASNAAQFLSEVRRKTGIEIKVISGKEEARLIAKGVLHNESPRTGRFGIIDIGGGSVEIILCKDREIIKSCSLQLGVARLQQVFLKTIPPKSIDSLKEHCRNLLTHVTKNNDWPRVPVLVGSSGTVRALSKMSIKHSGKKDVHFDYLKMLTKKMSKMSTLQLLHIPGMEPKRVDLILAGAIVLQETMRVLKTDKVIPTNYSLRDGVLEDELKTIRKHQLPKVGLRLHDLEKKAIELGAHPKHFKKIGDFAKRLFYATQPIHRLKDEWLDDLLAASILHDVGESINPFFHDLHSYYIAMNGDFPYMSDEERELIALLCLFHRREKIAEKKIPFWKNSEKRTIFLKLLAILRVADALDHTHQEQLEIKRVQCEAGVIKIFATGPETCQLDILRAEQKKSLFEKMLKRKLIIMFN